MMSAPISYTFSSLISHFITLLVPYSTLASLLPSGEFLTCPLSASDWKASPSGISMVHITTS